MIITLSICVINVLTGNKKIASVTEQGSYELRVDMSDFEGNTVYAHYSAFSISRDNKYKLWLGTYTGNAGNMYYSTLRA